jgi:hypothetical protein
VRATRQRTRHSCAGISRYAQQRRFHTENFNPRRARGDSGPP